MSTSKKNRNMSTSKKNRNANAPSTSGNQSMAQELFPSTKKCSPLRKATLISQKHCATETVEVHATMLPFLLVYKTSDDDDGIQPMMLNVNHNGVNEQKTAEIVNNIYGNPVNIQNNHLMDYAVDMQAFAHVWDRVSLLCIPHL